MKVSLIEEYISSVYQNYPVVSKEEFITDISIDTFCPVIETPVAMLYTILMKMIKPKRVLELGTSIGYSTTIIAKALAKWGGTITSVEFDETVAHVAKENFQKYGVSDSIELINDDVFNVLPGIIQKFDVVFIDLFNDIYPEVLDNCVELLNSGGILIADDTLFPILKTNSNFETSNRKTHEFNMRLGKRNDIESIIIPLDDGITLAIKK